MTNPLMRVWNGEDLKLCILEFCWKGREKKMDMREVCSALPDITAFIFKNIYLFILVVQTVKNLPAMQETKVQSLGWEDPLEEEMATHSSILAWRIPWTEEPGGLQSVALQKVRHGRAINTFTFFLVQATIGSMENKIKTQNKLQTFRQMLQQVKMGSTFLFSDQGWVFNIQYT